MIQKFLVRMSHLYILKNLTFLSVLQKLKFTILLADDSHATKAIGKESNYNRNSNEVHFDKPRIFKFLCLISSCLLF